MKDVDWAGIAFFVCIAAVLGAMAVALPIEKYMDGQTDISAMEHGYVQQVVDGKVVWVKDKGEK